VASYLLCHSKEEEYNPIAGVLYHASKPYENLGCLNPDTVCEKFAVVGEMPMLVTYGKVRTDHGDDVTNQKGVITLSLMEITLLNF